MEILYTKVKFWIWFFFLLVIAVNDLNPNISYNKHTLYRLSQASKARILDIELIEIRRNAINKAVFKIEFVKIYDHVEWDFLDFMLNKKGLRAV